MVWPQQTYSWRLKESRQNKRSIQTDRQTGTDRRTDRIRRYELDVRDKIATGGERQNVDKMDLGKGARDTVGRMKERARTVKILDSEGKCLSPFEFTQL